MLPQKSRLLTARAASRLLTFVALCLLILAPALLNGQNVPSILTVVSPSGRLELSPGMVAFVYGRNLSATFGPPSPANKVLVSGAPALIYYVSPEAISFRIPQVTPPGSATVTVVNNGLSSAPFQILLADYSPELVTTPEGATIALHANRTPITAADPATVGESIHVYPFGLGAKNPPPLPAVTMGGVRAVAETVTIDAFNISGLYELTFVVPVGLGSGAYPVVVTIGGKSSPASVIPVRAFGLILSSRGATFQAVTGTPAVLNRKVSVKSAGGIINWTATASTLAGGSWLLVSPAAGTSDSSKPPPDLQITVTPGALPPADYYGLVTIQPSGSNFPLFVTVVLSVVSAAQSPGALVEPTGIVFVSPSGGVPSAQNIQILNPTTTTLTFTSRVQATPVTWFNYQPAGGAVAPGALLNIAVQPVAGLARGVYSGSISFQFSDGRIRVVTLLFIVAKGAAAGPGGLARSPLEEPCVPSMLMPVVTTLGDSFTNFVGWGAQIESQIFDNCAQPLTDGSVLASFTNTDPAVPLVHIDAERWAAGWTPAHAVTPMTVTVDAQSSSLPPLVGSVSVSGSTLPNPSVPVINSGGVLNSASYVASPAPGTLISIFGSGLADTAISAPGFPLGFTLGSTSVMLGGRQVPLFYVSDPQINAIVPYGLTPDSEYQLIVRRETLGKVAISTSEVIVVPPTQPGVYTSDRSGTGQGLVFKVTGGALASSDAPAVPGDYLTVYCTGLGEIDPKLLDGYPAPKDIKMLIRAVVMPRATIGGMEAPVIFAGLAPTFAGLYQVNLRVPDGVPCGDATELILIARDRSSVPVTLATRASSATACQPVTPPFWEDQTRGRK